MYGSVEHLGIGSVVVWCTANEILYISLTQVGFERELCSSTESDQLGSARVCGPTEMACLNSAN